MTAINAISLFSGAGGLDIGSELAKVPVVFSTDIEPDCISTLKLNKGIIKSTILQADLTKTSTETILDNVHDYSEEKTIVIGGAPCQPFSKAGYWVGNDTRKGINDPRAFLVNEYLRVVQEAKPAGFVFENVESLLHPTNKIIVDKFIEIISKCGYTYKIIKANALDYGVPQKRKRIFIIGTKGQFSYEFPIKTHSATGEDGLKKYEAVGPLISKFDDDKYFEPEEVVTGTYYEDLCQVPPGMNYKALTAWYGYENPKFVADKRFWSFLLKLSPELPSWTITAQPGPWVGPFHWDNRRLRAPESAAIQSFPDSYKFYGTRSSIQKQIGNAVPPLMGASMVKFLKDSL